MGRASTARTARWEVEATDLTAEPARSGEYLTAGQLSDAINLSPGTIMDSITRARITVTDNPRSAICRPAARIGRLPLWSPQQRDEFLRIREEAKDSKDIIRKLEAVDEEEARQRSLYSLVEFAAMFNVHDQTLRRAQGHDGTFPKAVARRRKDLPGVPEHLFPLGPMVDWAHAKGYAVNVTVVR